MRRTALGQTPSMRMKKLNPATVTHSRVPEVGQGGEIAYRSMDRLSDRSQVVGGREYDTDRRDDQPPAVRAERLEHRRELSREPRQSRKSQARERGEHERYGPDGDNVSQPAKPPEFACVRAVVQQPDQQEEQPRDESVADHAEHRRAETARARCRDGDEHESHVGDGRVGDESLQVGLHERRQGPEDDADQPDGEDDAPGRFEGRRAERDRDAKDAVAAHLEQHAGEHDRARRRSLDVRVRKPCVQRPGWHLDEEASHEQPEHERALRLRRRRDDQLGDRPGARGVDRHEDARRASARCLRRCRGRTSLRHADGARVPSRR